MASRVRVAGPLVLLALAGAEGLDAQVTFIDRAPQTQTTSPGLGRGCAMTDLDGDGRVDLVAANAKVANTVFRQRPDHTFEEVSRRWGIGPDMRTSWGVLVADFDNDGDADVYFINGGFGAAQANQLLRNDLNSTGAFTDVSGAAGDAAIVSTNFGGTALDYDRDGDVDIFLTTTPDPQRCILLRNEGALVFSDVSSGAGLSQPGMYLHCSSGDFDNDGWMDVAVGNYDGANRLYRNQGDGTFQDVAVVAGVASPDQNFGLVLEDFDNDGWMDLYVPKYRLEPKLGPSELYRNAGDGTFVNVTAGSGMTAQTDMGHNTGDLDADGYPDIYIGTGMPHLQSDDVLFLVRPDGAGGFSAADVSQASGITANGPTRCHGMALGDYDGDGQIDVYTNNGGVQAIPGSIEENALWQNQGNDHHWAALHLRGVVSNRSAVGTRCVAVTGSGREIHRRLRVGSGFANTNSPVQHFGLGSEDELDRIEITWPSGIRQTIWSPPLGTVIEVVERRPACPADLNLDLVVDVLDLLAVLLAWGTGDPAADINGDGIVDIHELVELLFSWGSCPPVGPADRGAPGCEEGGST